MVKTIAVEKIKHKINKILTLSDIPQEGKKELCILLEDILQETDNYKGFSPLDGEEFSRYYY